MYACVYIDMYTHVCEVLRRASPNGFYGRSRGSFALLVLRGGRVRLRVFLQGLCGARVAGSRMFKTDCF